MSAAASIDFCESNYIVSKHIAELMNSLSSLIFVLVAWYGYKYGIRGMIHTSDVRHENHWAWYSLMIIGVGSFLFHARLDRFTQILDELPMMWQMLHLLYESLLLYDARLQHHRSTVSFRMIVFGILVSLIYLLFPQYYLLFLVIFISMKFTMIALMHECVKQCGRDLVQNQNVVLLIAQLFHGAKVTFVLAISCWLTDMLFCAWLPWFVYAHALWHLLICVSVYLLILTQKVMWLQRSCRPIQCRLEWSSWYGIIPLLLPTLNVKQSQATV